MIRVHKRKTFNVCDTVFVLRTNDKNPIHINYRQGEWANSYRIAFGDAKQLEMLMDDNQLAYSRGFKFHGGIIIRTNKTRMSISAKTQP